MSTTIDNKIVSMKFDNKDFEKNVGQSLSTLDKLKAKLKLDKASKGLDDLGRASKNVSFDGMLKGADAVQVKFSHLQATVQHQLDRIVDNALDAGKRLVNAFTLEPLKTGFDEYELKMGSVQTIMASTGASLETVNKYLDELNTYSDKTIYSFADMTNNIGKFTNAGVKLEDAVAAIKGVSNEAAVSGANANEASRAMYNFAQALSAGSVKLIDWKSIENANMATVEFKNELLKTALAMGTVIKVGNQYKTVTTNAKGQVSDLFDATHNFNDSLNHQWMTTDVLTKTLAKYADETTAIGKKAYASAQDVKTFSMMMDTLKEAAQSGWAQTWEIIFGDFNQAKSLWTNLANFFGALIDKMSKARNFVLDQVMNNPLTQLGKKISTFTKTAKEATEKVQDLGKVVDKVISGKFGNGQKRIDALTKSGYNWAKVQNAVNEKLGSSVKHKVQDDNVTKKLTKSTSTQVKVLENLSNKQLKNLGLTDDEIAIYRDLEKQAKKTGKSIGELIDATSKRKTGRQLLMNTAKNLKNSLSNSLKAIGEAWRNVFPEKTIYEKAEGIYGVLKKFNDVSKDILKASKSTDTLTRTFHGLFSALHLVSTIFGGTLRIVMKVISTVLSHFNLNILDVTAAIGDVITKVDQWITKNNFLTKAISGGADIVVKSAKAIGSFIKKIREIPVVQNGSAKAIELFSKTVKIVGGYFNECGDRIDAFIERVKSLDHISLDNIDDIFKDFKENVLDYIFDINGRFEDFKNSFKKLKQSIINELSDGSTKFGIFKDTIIGKALELKSKLSSLDILGPLLTIGIGVGLLKTIKAIDKLFDVLKTLASPIEGISDALSGLPKMMKAWSNEKNSKAILNVAEAIALLAGSLLLLSKTDSDGLIKAAGALTVITVAMGGMFVLMSKLGGLSVATVGLTMVGVSTAILTIVKTLKKMEDLDATKVWRNMGILASIAGGMLVFSALSRRVGKGMSGLILAAIAVRSFANILEKIDNMQLKNVRSSIITLLAIIKLLGVLTKISGKVDFKSTSGLLLMVISLRIFVNTLKKVCEFNANNITKNLGSLITIVGTFALLMKASSKAGKYSAKAGVMMLSISAAMILMTVAIKRVSKISQEDLRSASSAISQMIIVFGAVVMMSKLAGENATKAGAMILMMSGALLAISVVATILSKLDPDGLSRAIIAIDSIIGCFALLVAASGLSKDCSQNLTKMSTTIAILAISLGALSLIDPERLATVSTSLGIVMGMFSVMIATTKLATNATKSLVTMTAVVGGLAIILGIMSALDVEGSLANASSISILLLSMSASMTMLSKIKKVSSKSLAALGIMTAVVGALAGILGIMDALNVEGSIETAASLSILLVSMSAVSLILSVLGKTGTAAIQGALVFDGVIVAIGGLMVAIGALVDNIPSLETFLDKGITVLNKIGKGIGTFIGNIIGGIGEGATDALPKIGKNMKKFTDALSGIDDKSVSAAKNLAEVLILLGGAELLDTLTSWFTGDNSMEDFGPQLAQFGKGIADFSNAVDGKVNSEAVKNASEAGKGIVELAGLIPNSGGWLGAIVGNNDIEDFAPQMVKLAEGIVDFSNAVDGKTNTTAINDATAAGKGIVQLASLIPNSGGWLGAIVGNNDIEDFAPQLVKFGKGIADFSSAVDGKVNSYAIRSATDGGKEIVELSKLIPNSGGWLGAIVGNNDIKDFAPQLIKLGMSIADFSNAVDGKINSSAIRSATEGGKGIVQLCKLIPNSGGWLGAIVGNKDISKLKPRLEKLGDSFTVFNKSDLVSANTANIDKAITNVQNLAKLFNEMGKIDTVGVDNFNKAMAKSSKESVDAYVKNINNGATKSKNSMSKFFSNTLSAFSNNKEFGKAGSSNVDAYTKQVEKDSSNVKNAHKKSAKSGVDGIRSTKDSFANAGKYVTDGFLSGINIKIKDGSVSNAGKRLGKAAEEGARKALDIHSPSRKMKKVGEYTVAGFVKALNGKGTVDVKKASEKLMKAFVTSATKASTVSQYSKGIISKFANFYIKTTKNITKQTKIASKAISEYSKKLYKESDAYKQDKKNLKDHMKILKNYYKQKASLQVKSKKSEVKQTKAYNKKLADLEKRLSESKKSDKQSKKLNGKESKTTKNLKEQIAKLKKEGVSADKSLANSLNNIDKNIKKTKKQIKKDQEEIAKNVKKTLNELKKSIKESVKEYVSVFNVEFDEIDLFDTTALENSVSGSLSEAKQTLIDSLKSFNSILDISLDVGGDIFSKFSDGAEDTANAIADAEKSLTDATKDLTDAQKDLTDTQKELNEYRKKSADVDGRSQRYLDKIKELEEKEAEVKQKVADAINSQAEAQEKLNEANGDNSVSDMLSNMDSNVTGIKELRANLDELAKRGIDEGLLKSLKDLGVSGVQQVKTFIKMTDEELKHANESFREYGKLSAKNLVDGFKDKKDTMVAWGDLMKKFANKEGLDDAVKAALLTEFQDKGVESAEYINTILNMTEDELKDFNTNYLDIIGVPDQIANEVIAAQNKIEKAKAEKSKTNAVTDFIETGKAAVAAAKEYDKNLDKLEKKVKKGAMSADFFEYLKALGPESADTIKDFANASMETIAQANAVYQQKVKQENTRWIESYTDTLTDAKEWDKNMEKFSKLNIPKKIKEALLEEFKDKGPEDSDMLERILGFDKKDLDKFVKAYSTGTKLQNSIANDVVASMANATVDQKNLDKAKNNTKKAAKEITATGKTAAKEGGTAVGKAAVNSASTSMKSNSGVVVKSGKTVGNEVLTAIKGKLSSSKGKNIATNLVDGLATGLTDSLARLNAIGGALGDSLLKSTKKKLDIHSPSKKFAEIGKYSCLGLVQGLTGYSNVVRTSSEQVADEALDVMAEKISQLASITDEELDYTPTIRPVLDMSDVTSKAGTINGMFGADSIAVNASMASDLSSRMNASQRSQNGSTTNNSYDNSNSTINNTFNITGDNPREIADEVSRILQKQVSRRGAAWA